MHFTPLTLLLAQIAAMLLVSRALWGGQGLHWVYPDRERARDLQGDGVPAATG